MEIITYPVHALFTENALYQIEVFTLKNVFLKRVKVRNIHIEKHSKFESCLLLQCSITCNNHLERHCTTKTSISRIMNSYNSINFIHNLKHLSYLRIRVQYLKITMIAILSSLCLVMCSVDATFLFRLFKFLWSFCKAFVSFSRFLINLWALPDLFFFGASKKKKKNVYQ